MTFFRNASIKIFNSVSIPRRLCRAECLFGFVFYDVPGLATVSNAAGADQIDGINTAGYEYPAASVNTYSVIPGYGVTLSQNTTYYLKINPNYSLGNPQYRSRLSARKEGQ